MPDRRSTHLPVSLRTTALTLILPLAMIACGGSDGGAVDSAEVTADVDAATAEYPAWPGSFTVTTPS